MEHEKLPGSTERELLEFEWWMVLLDASILIYAIYSGSIFWLIIGLYLSFSTLVCTERKNDTTEDTN